MDPPAHPPASTAASLLRHGLMVAVFCCLVGLGLTVSTGKPWDQQLVYSLAIGMTTWLTIDLGRLPWARGAGHPWPPGLAGLLLVLLGIAVGFVVGSAVGDLYCGCSTWDHTGRTSDRLASSLVITVSAGVAGAYFFHSRAKHQGLQARIALAERDATLTRLRLLQAQLEPHMLFNTLANLRALIDTDPAQATHMLDHLVAYLRATLTASRATEHALEQEFGRLRDYLKLMAVRMGPRLRYTFELPAELAHVPIPSLLLQALVENSIQHGLEPSVQGGDVVISAHATANALQLTVLDTGLGMRRAPASQGEGFGLTQVRERLAARYGDAATMVVESPLPQAGGGTRVRLTLPREEAGIRRNAI